MTIPVVFVASSSEGLGLLASVQQLLQRSLGDAVEVKSWSGAFELTRTYIESLERLLDASDFAVLLLTPDDRTKSRELESPSPRDNLVFEAGLFMGRLGRDRCFLIRSSDLGLKLPSDLTGVEPATFSPASLEDLAATVEPACTRIGRAIRHAMSTLPSRPRLGDAERAKQTAIRRLADRIKGSWWERISMWEEDPVFGFFTIRLDDVHSSVQLIEGKAYAQDGTRLADWRSAAVHLNDERMIYVRECQRADVRNTAWLPGLAEVDFTVSGDVIAQGRGKFWESDESRPESTVIKRIEIRRELDEARASIMEHGSEQDRRALVQWRREAAW